MSSTPPSVDRDDGSDASYEAMFRRHYPRAVALGIALSSDVESGHDLAQETMLRAYKRWDEISGHEFVWAWLRRVLTNLVVDRTDNESSSPCTTRTIVRSPRSPT